MILLGITGGIGSGKSTISELLSLSGIPVYIADIESKKLVENSPLIRKKLIELFGEALYEGGKLNRSLLASHIFGDDRKLALVNKIIHPEVKKDLREWMISKKHHDIVATESAILFESGFHTLTDKKITVYAPLDTRIERIIKRDNTTREKVLNRIQSQMPDEEKVKLSDYVIVNDETESLIDQIMSILNQLNKNSNVR